MLPEYGELIEYLFWELDALPRPSQPMRTCDLIICICFFYSPLIPLLETDGSTTGLDTSGYVNLAAITDLGCN